MISLWLPGDLFAGLEDARSADHCDRSTFIRKLLATEFRRRAIPFDEASIYPPDRANKGRLPGQPAASSTLPGAKTGAIARAGVGRQADKLRQRKPSTDGTIA